MFRSRSCLAAEKWKERKIKGKIWLREVESLLKFGHLVVLGSVAVVALVMNLRFCLGFWVFFLLHFIFSQTGNRFVFSVILFFGELESLLQLFQLVVLGSVERGLLPCDQYEIQF